MGGWHDSSSEPSRLCTTWCFEVNQCQLMCEWGKVSHYMSMNWGYFLLPRLFIAGGCGYIIEWSIWLVASTGCLKYVSTIDIHRCLWSNTSFMAEDHSGSGQRSWWLRVQAGQFPALEHQGRKVFLPGSSPRNHRTKWRFYWKNTETNHL